MSGSADFDRPSRGSPGARGAESAHTVRLLVIDDDDVLRDLLADVLASAGYRVTRARNGADELRRFAEEGHDVVISDVRMPGLDGWQVARVVRQAAPEAGILLLSGEFERRGATPPGDPLRATTMPKPFEVDELFDAIDRAWREVQPAETAA
jgi:DNA-binding response OmpR family regulator